MEITGLPASLWSCSVQLGGGRDFWGRDGTEEIEWGQSLSTLAFKELKLSVKWEVGSPWGERTNTAISSIAPHGGAP